jgi:hypothetical protein
MKTTSRECQERASGNAKDKRLGLSRLDFEDTASEIKRKRGRPNIHEDVPVSLAPLDFETALAGLLQVSPESKGKPTAKKKAPQKKRAAKKTAKR